MMSQEDINWNGIGDACECEADFDSTSTVDSLDAINFKKDFGRTGCPSCEFICSY